MIRDVEVPELEQFLEDGFSEMKIGEENFDSVRENVVKEVENKDKINYGQKFSSAGNEQNIIVKPIKSVKSTIDSPSELKNDDKEGVEDSKKLKFNNDILLKPSSGIGEEFDVDW
tara:strand:+ start:84 stop:428 length:345 start_codon:yes stop_codon:yes gene_type:complete